MSDYPMLISNKLHSFRNFDLQTYHFYPAVCNLFKLITNFIRIPKVQRNPDDENPASLF